MFEKQCTACGKAKPRLAFGRSSKTTDGRKHICKECARQQSVDYYRTVGGVINSLYTRHTLGAVKRNIEPATYTKLQLGFWLLSQRKFLRIMESWKASGFDRTMAPSVDRLDDYKGYTLDNIQLMTWGENKAKGHTDCFMGVNNKRSSAVLMCGEGNTIINSFKSIQAAARATGLQATKICACCKGRKKTTGGYIWKYTTSEVIR